MPDDMGLVARVGLDGGVVVDFQLRTDDLGIALLDRQISIGSKTRGIDERFELVDYVDIQAFVDDAVGKFLELASPQRLTAKR